MGIVRRHRRVQRGVARRTKHARRPTDEPPARTSATCFFDGRCTEAALAVWAAFGLDLDESSFQARPLARVSLPRARQNPAQRDAGGDATSARLVHHLTPEMRPHKRAEY